MILRYALPVLCVLSPFSNAHAQPAPIWGGYFNMGIFAAGGGSEADGHISLECTGDHLADAGAFFMQLTPASDIEPFVNAPPELDFVVDDEVFSLPVTADAGAIFFYRSDPAEDELTLSLIEALRRGQHLRVSAPEVDIAQISLRGSSRALIYVEQCVMEND